MSRILLNRFGAAAITMAVTVMPLAAAHGATAYKGDPQFSQVTLSDATPRPTAKAGTYDNPILPGFYPDPSVIRVGDDYTLINSSFSFYPGIPVFHSKDLVHWTQVGNAIDRPTMLDFSGLNASRGVYAPDISYHDGTYAILNTCVDCKGNFVITAKDPTGPWSDPVWLGFDGIDPSLFWDDDGKAYIVNNGLPDGPPRYDGHRAIWLQQFDPVAKAMTGPRQIIIDGGAKIDDKPVWIEGPHLFKKGGIYYLMAAEGGTAENHSEVVFRADNVRGPYRPYDDNPILTQRDLDPGRAAPITSSGHADLVETQTGQWWSVLLATRPYAPGLYNTGRETFLLPVTWKDGWPIILPHGQAIPLQAPIPMLPAASNPAKPQGLDPLALLSLRTPVTAVYQITGPRALTVKAMPEALGDLKTHPAFVGLRQRSANVSFSTTIHYRPEAKGDRAGIVALQNDDFYLFYGLAVQDGREVLEVMRRAGPQDPQDGVVIAAIPLTPKEDQLSLSMEITDGTMRCDYTLRDGKKVVLADKIDATTLSTKKAGGFVGTVIGLYAYGKNRTP